MISALRGLGVLAGFGATLAVWIFLDTEQAGIYYSALALFFLFAYFTKFGIDDFSLKSAATDIEDQSLLNTFIKSTVIYLCIFALLIASFPLIRPYIIEVYGDSVLVVLINLFLGLFFFQAAQTIGVILQGRGRYKSSIVLVYFFPQSLQIILISLFQLNTAEHISLVFSGTYFLSSVLAVIIFVRGLENLSFAKIQWLYKSGDIPELFTYWVTSVSAQLQLHAPTAISASYLEYTQVALLAFTLKCCQLSYSLLVIVNYNFAPRARKLFLQGDLSRVWSLYKKSALICLQVLVGLTIAVYIGFKIMHFANVTKFIQIELLFWVLWPSFFINVAFGPIGFLLIMTNKQKVLAQISLVLSVTLCLSLLAASYLASLPAVVAICFFSVILSKFIPFIAYKCT